MWLYFNKHGQLLEMIDNGNHARAGTTAFEIVAFFEDVNINSYYSTATIKLRKPDLAGSEYPTLLMKKDERAFHGSSQRLEDNHLYPVYVFDFGDFNDAEDAEVLLDTPGLWEAIITIIGANRELNVQGVATFNVETGTFSEEQSEVNIEVVLNQIYEEMGTKMSIKSSAYLHVVEDISVYELEGFPSTVFTIGDIIYDVATNNYYKLTGFHYSDLVKIVEPMDRFSNEFVTVVDDIANTDLFDYQVGKVFQDRATGLFYKKTNDGYESLGEENIPNLQMTYSIVINALTNINGRVLSAYTVVEGTLSDYPYIQILRDGQILSEAQAKSYMEYMTGSRYLPVYNYEKPKNSLFIFADGSLYKPQYDNEHGLLLFKVPVPYATLVQLATKVAKITTEGTRVYAHTGDVDNDVAYSSSVANDALVQRTATGQVKTPAPVDNDDATNKNYVDTEVNKVLFISNLSNNLSASDISYCQSNNARIKYNGYYFEKAYINGDNIYFISVKRNFITTEGNRIESTPIIIVNQSDGSLTYAPNEESRYTNAKIDDKFYDKNAIDTNIYTKEQSNERYYDKTATENLLGQKQDNLTWDETPTAGSNNPVKSKGIKSFVESVASDLKSNAFIKVDTTTYTSLADFLANATGEEGYIYLYPIKLTDLTKGYYQYIIENNEWLDIGTTKIDLSDYVEKSRKIAGIDLEDDITANELSVKLNEISFVQENYTTANISINFEDNRDKKIVTSIDPTVITFVIPATAAQGFLASCTIEINSTVPTFAATNNSNFDLYCILDGKPLSITEWAGSVVDNSTLEVLAECNGFMVILYARQILRDL